jgi:hypothetical protein
MQMAVRKNETSKAPEAAKADISKAASPVPSFNPNDPAFQAILAQAVQARLALMQAEKPAKLSVAGKTEKQIKSEMACVRAFKRAGFGVVVPHIDTKTFAKWAAEGFRPKEGTKAVKVGAFRLFHRSQLRKLTAEEKEKLVADQKAAIDRHVAAEKAKVVPLNP